MESANGRSPFWLCPPIAYNILEHLPAKQLNTCSQVCELWRKIAQNIKKRRKRKVSCFFHSMEGATSSTSLDTTVSHIENLYNEPKCVLLFATQNPGYRYEHTVLDILPQSCDVGICTALCIIGAVPNKKEIQTIPASSNGVAAICFPYLVEASIHRFRLSGFPFGISFETDEDFYNYTGIPSDKPVKCFLIFVYDRISSSPSWDLTKTIVNFFINKANGLAIGGAQIRRMSFPKYSHRRRNQGYGIAFVGDRIEAASIIIPSTVEMEERSNKLKTFSHLHTMDGQCLAFVFQNFKTNCSVEVLCRDSCLFNNLYPNVPLFGAVGIKELGFEYLPNDSQNYASKKFPDIRVNTTVFIFIIIKN